MTSEHLIPKLVTVISRSTYCFNDFCGFVLILTDTGYNIELLTQHNPQ